MTTLKCYFLSIAMCAVSYQAFCQKHDYVWLTGYESIGGQGSGHGIAKFDFNSQPVSIAYDSLGMNFTNANTSMCDSNGNLLFYTNGIYIANALDEKIENSDSLSFGYIGYEWDVGFDLRGYIWTQAVVSLPSLTNPNQYFVLHSWVDTFQGRWASKRVFLTVVDIEQNNGHGKVVSKRQTVLQGVMGWELSAVKHANGRDWWVLVQKRESNCYNKILIDSSGVHALPDLTCGGSSLPWDGGAGGASCFSPNGSKYVYLNYSTGVNIFDFNRCTGELSNSTYLPLPSIQTNNWESVGVAISPSNRFLYVNAAYELYQFDLWSVDIMGSIDTLNTLNLADTLFTALRTPQLAPDGKIYYSCATGERFMHVIENPDLKGDSCNFKLRGVNIPVYCNSIPNFPNYRLGALVGSPCDTLNNANYITEKERYINLYPNPATDFVVVDYGFTDWSKGDVALEIINSIGQVVYQKMMPRYSGFQKIDVSEYPSGMYSAIIKRNGATVAVSKFVKE